VDVPRNTARTGMELQGVPKQAETEGSGNNFIIFKLENTSGDS